ncbi:MAG: hypothetical protein UZ22_OP11002001152 [Microgenomates bacterium OLB23]|nr:MAG: hypothetical protein UZ22_OP11002001152 [Microgenomates bacterium OLB23]
MPVKERRTKILLLLFLLKDTSFDYVSLKPEYLVLFDLVINQKTKGSLSAMLKEGLIEKRDEENGSDDEGSQYRLTDKGFYRLCLDFPSFRYLKDEWDGIWRIISYEIPEKKNVTCVIVCDAKWRVGV